MKFYVNKIQIKYFLNLITYKKDLKWSKPTPIQKKSIPIAIQSKDVIGLAETGSGKTAAFAIPVIQALLNSPGESRFACLVMTPTRELAFQIRDQFLALGSSIGLQCACIVGGVDIMSQEKFYFTISD